MNIVKKIYIVLYKGIFNFIYTLCSLFKKIDENKIVFVLSRENKLQGNMQFVFFELKKNYTNKKVYFMQASNKMNIKSFQELIKMSDAKYIILDDYYLPIYLIQPNKEMKIIQLWHAAGALKKFGYSTVGTKFGSNAEYLSLVPIHSNYTHVYVSSVNAIPYYAEAFNMSPKQIFALGIPRTDAFFNESYKQKKIKKIYEEYPKLKNGNKINVLIAPTYRASGDYGESSLDFVDIIIEISSKLNKNIQMLYRPHPYTGENEIKLLNNKSNINVIKEFTLNDWMLISDAFITDYSSAIFDYSLLYKPFAHYIPDIDEYKANRGLYEQLNKVSDGDVISDTDSLLGWINTRKKNEYCDTSKMVNYNFTNVQGSTKKIVKHFIEK